MFEILDFAKGELLKYLPGEGAVLADFTLGGGHDTAYFAALPQVARVYSFDIQPQAIQRGRSLLQQMGPEAEGKVQLILDSHDRCDRYIAERLDGGMFNLGFLPGGEKGITTRRESTLPAIAKALGLLKPGRVLTAAVYPGHEEGRLEGEAIGRAVQLLHARDCDVFQLRLWNVPDCPYLYLFYKKRDFLLEWSDFLAAGR